MDLLPPPELDIALQFLQKARAQFIDHSPPSYMDKNRPALKWRFPAVWEALRLVTPPEKFEVVCRPERTLTVNDIHMASSYNRKSEAELIGSRIPPGSTEVAIYGLGLGDVQRYFLSKDEISKVHVVIMTPQIDWLSLQYFDHSDWINDKRVTITLGLWHEAIEHPFTLYPQALRFVPDEYLRLSQLLMLEIIAPHQQMFHVERRPFYQERIAAAEPFVAKDHDVRELLDTLLGTTSVVCGGGPTLGEFYAWLKEHKNFNVIAVSTVLKPMLANGIIPDMVVILDPNDDMLSHFEGIDYAQLEHTKLVYVPLVHHQIIERWPGPRYAGYIEEKSLSALSKKYPRGVLYCGGTVMHMATDLAVCIGSSTVILLGFDCGFPGEMTHVEGATQSTQAVTLHRPQILNGYGRRIYTEPNLIGYLIDMEGYVQYNNGVKWIKGGKEGAAMHGTRWLEDIQL